MVNNDMAYLGNLTFIVSPVVEARHSAGTFDKCQVSQLPRPDLLVQWGSVGIDLLGGFV